MSYCNKHASPLVGAGERCPACWMIEDIIRQRGRIKELEAEREWTSVEDGLPEEGVPVLVVSAHWPDSVYAALRIDEGDGWLWAQMGAYGGNLNDVSDYEADDDYRYSHWRPLPAPPAGEQA